MSRYIAVGVAAFEAFLFAYLLGVESYGEYAVMIQIASSLMLLGFGNASGYVYSYYINSISDNDESYILMSLTQYLLGTGVVFIGLVIVKPQWLASIVIFLIQTPYLITEPLFRVRSLFVVPVIGKGIGSLMTILLMGIFYLSRINSELGKISINRAVVIVILGNLLGYSIYYLGIIWAKDITIDSLKKLKKKLKRMFVRERIAQYWMHVLKPGMAISVSSLVFMLFINVDRFFIEHFHSAQILSTYSLAWQLSQGAGLLLTSLNLMSNIRIGQNISNSRCDNELTELLKKELVLTFCVGFSVFIALICASYVLNILIYRDYNELVKITALVSGGYLSIYIAGAVTSLLNYEGHHLGLVIGWVVALVISVGCNLSSVYFKLWYGSAVAMTSFTLVLLSLWLVAYTYLTLEKRATTALQ